MIIHTDGPADQYSKNHNHYNFIFLVYVYLCVCVCLWKKISLKAKMHATTVHGLCTEVDTKLNTKYKQKGAATTQGINKF